MRPEKNCCRNMNDGLSMSSNVGRRNGFHVITLVLVNQYTKILGTEWMLVLIWDIIALPLSKQRWNPRWKWTGYFFIFTWNVFCSSDIDEVLSLIS